MVGDLFYLCTVFDSNIRMVPQISLVRVSIVKFSVSTDSSNAAPLNNIRITNKRSTISLLYKSVPPNSHCYSLLIQKIITSVSRRMLLSSQWMSSITRLSDYHHVTGRVKDHEFTLISYKCCKNKITPFVVGAWKQLPIVTLQQRPCSCSLLLTSQKTIHLTLKCVKYKIFFSLNALCFCLKPFPISLLTRQTED